MYTYGEVILQHLHVLAVLCTYMQAIWRKPGELPGRTDYMGSS